MRNFVVAAGSVALLLLVGCNKKSDQNVAEEQTPDLDTVVTDLGFYPVKAPRPDIGPGTIVAIMSKKPPYDVDIICGSSDAFPDGLNTFPNNSTISGKWQNNANVSFNASADVKDYVNAKFGADSVKNVSFELSQPTIPELARLEVDKAVKKHPPMPECVSEIKRAFAAHQQVTMLASGLQGNAVYTVNFGRDFSADVQAQITKAVAAKLGLQTSQAGQSTVSGNGLIWGVKPNRQMLDAYLGNPVVGLSPERAQLAAQRETALPLGPMTFRRQAAH